MNIHIYPNPQALGQAAAEYSAEVIRKAIAEKGEARIILSTGASQFTTLEALLTQKVEWNKVVMFHLDEYIGLDESHPASFIRYLKERFVSKVNLKEVHFVDPKNGVPAIIATLTKEVRKAPIDLGLIGIGENAHLAFNDPPADFATKEAYIVVNLDSDCRKQQVGEGWFKTLDDVPTQAISMTVSQILMCKEIVSAVPYKVKAKAIANTLGAKEVTPLIPATALKNHPRVNIFLDQDSASLLPQDN